jgi:hypothetical protein
MGRRLKFFSSWIGRLTIGRRFKWAWLLLILGVPFSARSYFVLQLLSAELLFTTLLLMAALLIALFAALLLAAGYASERTFDALVSHIRSSIPDFALFPTQPVYHISLGADYKIRNQRSHRVGLARAELRRKL